MSLDEKIDNLKMRITGFKNKHKETLYKDDGRYKNTTETSRDRAVRRLHGIQG
jgi:hypothetical protein